MSFVKFGSKWDLINFKEHAKKWLLSCGVDLLDICCRSGACSSITQVLRGNSRSSSATAKGRVPKMSFTRWELRKKMIDLYKMLSTPFGHTSRATFLLSFSVLSLCIHALLCTVYLWCGAVSNSYIQQILLVNHYEEFVTSLTLLRWDSASKLGQHNLWSARRLPVMFFLLTPGFTNHRLEDFYTVCGNRRHTSAGWCGFFHAIDCEI